MTIKIIIMTLKSRNSEIEIATYCHIYYMQFQNHDLKINDIKISKFWYTKYLFIR